MKQFLNIFLLLTLYSTFGQSSTYTSKLTEYFINENRSDVPTEWIDRDIIISDSTIRIISKGKIATDIQTWSIYNKVSNRDTYESNTVYYTNLASSEMEYENPSVFIVYENKDGKVELIDWQIPNPPNAKNNKRYFYRFHIN